MTIQYKYFSIPADDPEEEEELNRFLRSVKVLKVHHEFCAATGTPAWYARVDYLAAGKAENQTHDKIKERKDYKKLLSPDEFALFAILRDWRKKVGDQEKSPLYTIFTNEQLAKIAGQRPETVQQLKEIEGVGDSRVGKYGNSVISIIKSHQLSATSRQQADS